MGDFLENGLYFVHGYYASDVPQETTYNLRRDHLIVVKDSMDDIFDIEAYDINLTDKPQQNHIPQGEFVNYNGESFEASNDDPAATIYAELNKQLIRSIRRKNHNNQPKQISGQISNVYSYHINVGHGNCSIIVFCENGNYTAWMIDCSIYDFMNKKNYCFNLNECLREINERFEISKISKLLITHLHYDHINGIEYLIKRHWVDKNTEVWMNTKYPWKQPTYNRILLLLKSLKVKFIDPIVDNSTEHINILYPNVCFDKRIKPPENNINNSSILYKILLGGKSMLFTGDIEAEGWGAVAPNILKLCKSTYYCISHHGSITGHVRNQRIAFGHATSTMLSDYFGSTKRQVLMGRKGAYQGIYSTQVLDNFANIVKSEDARRYFCLDWNAEEVHFY